MLRNSCLRYRQKPKRPRRSEEYAVPRFLILAASDREAQQSGITRGHPCP